MQRQAFIDVPTVPLGFHYQPVAFSNDLAGMMKGLVLFTGVRHIWLGACCDRCLIIATALHGYRRLHSYRQQRIDRFCDVAVVDADLRTQQKGRVGS
jgi:hypothetical protein